MTDIFAKYSTEVSEFKPQIASVERKISTAEHKMSNINEELKNQLSNIHSELDSKISLTSSNLYADWLLKSVYNTNLKSIKENIQKLKFGLDDIDKNLTTTDNYLDKYLPFRIQNLISETLENVLDKEQIQKLTIFEGEKFKSLHERILADNGEPNLK